MRNTLIGEAFDLFSGRITDLHLHDGRYFWREMRVQHVGGGWGKRSRESVTFDSEGEARRALDCAEVVWHPWEESAD